MAAALVDYGALLRLAAPCARVLESCAGDGMRGCRGGGAHHQEQSPLSLALLSGSGGRAPTLVRQILRAARSPPAAEERRRRRRPAVEEEEGRRQRSLTPTSASCAKSCGTAARSPGVEER